MPLDAICTAALAAELEQEIAGGRIDKVQQPERDMLLLSLRANGKNRRLLIAAGTGNARVHLTEASFENPAEPPMFCMLLRKHLVGAQIVSIFQPEHERMLCLLLDTHDELGVDSRKQLVVEMIGRSANVILVGEDGRIIDCMRRVDFAGDALRRLLPGMIYGYGFWVVPPAFVLCTYILFTHKGKPVDGRISCALLLPIFFSAVMELGTELTPTDGLKFMDMVGKLFWTGQDLISGGVLGGLLAKGLEAAFSIYGAMPVLILLFLACLILAIRGSFKGMFSAVRIERQPYDPAAYAEPEKFTVPELRDARGVPVGKAPKPIERVNRGTYDVDLPLGEDEEPLNLFGSDASKPAPTGNP